MDKLEVLLMGNPRNPRRSSSFIIHSDPNVRVVPKYTRTEVDQDEARETWIEALKTSPHLRAPGEENKLADDTEIRSVPDKLWVIDGDDTTYETLQRMPSQEESYYKPIRANVDTEWSQSRMCDISNDPSHGFLNTHAVGGTTGKSHHCYKRNRTDLRMRSTSKPMWTQARENDKIDWHEHRENEKYPCCQIKRGQSNMWSGLSGAPFSGTVDAEDMEKNPNLSDPQKEDCLNRFDEWSHANPEKPGPCTIL